MCQGAGDRPSPILDGRSRVPAAADTEHDQHEEEEKGRGGEAHAVDSAETQQGAAVQGALQDHGLLGRVFTHPG